MACTEYRTRNMSREGRSDWERHDLCLEGSGPKAFGSNMRDACFPRHFRVPNNIIKYDGKTNPSVWLENYCFTCSAGRADDDLFII
jgi:hypothetical protein